MMPLDIEQKTAIEFNKMEEEKHLLQSLARLLKEMTRLAVTNSNDECSQKRIVIVRTKLLEFKHSYEYKPDLFPRILHPLLMQTIEDALNLPKANINLFVLNEIYRIARKDISIKLYKYIQNYHRINKPEVVAKSHDPIYNPTELVRAVTEAGLISIINDLLTTDLDPTLIVYQTILSGHVFLLLLLKEKYPTFFYYKKGHPWQLLSRAVSSGHIHIVEFILAQNQTTDIIDLVDEDTGYTPLHSAIKNIHIPIIELLITAGADLNKPSKNGLTPLQMTLQLYKRHQHSSDNANEKFFNIMRILIKFGATINSEDLELPIIKDLQNAKLAYDVLIQKINAFQEYKKNQHALDELKVLIYKQYVTTKPKIFYTTGLNLKNEAMLKTLATCPQQIYEILASLGVNFHHSDHQEQTPINFAIKLNLWDSVICMLMTMESDQLLDPNDKNLLIHHQEELTHCFISLIKKMQNEDQILYLKKTLGEKKPSEKSKPGNALGFILYTSASALKLSLFGRQRYRGEKVPPHLYQIVTVFHHLVPDAF